MGHNSALTCDGLEGSDGGHSRRSTWKHVSCRATTEDINVRQLQLRCRAEIFPLKHTAHMSDVGARDDCHSKQ
jgi:hypothetical protein